MCTHKLKYWKRFSASKSEGRSGILNPILPKTDTSSVAHSPGSKSVCTSQGESKESIAADSDASNGFPFLPSMPNCSYVHTILSLSGFAHLATLRYLCLFDNPCKYLQGLAYHAGTFGPISRNTAKASCIFRKLDPIWFCWIPSLIIRMLATVWNCFVDHTYLSHRNRQH